MLPWLLLLSLAALLSAGSGKGEEERLEIAVRHHAPCAYSRNPVLAKQQSRLASPEWVGAGKWRAAEEGWFVRMADDSESPLEEGAETGCYTLQGSMDLTRPLHAINLQVHA